MVRKPDSETNGFLSRWSRRKREGGLDDEAVAETVKTQQDEAPVDDVTETEEERANREAAEAVDIDALTYESDFSVFMKSGVPLLLRRAAMRKLWASNPVLANVDGLNDYDENFADPAMNVFKSAWQAGRGYLKEEPEDKSGSEKDEALSENQDENEENADVAEAGDAEPAAEADTDEPVTEELREGRKSADEKTEDAGAVTEELELARRVSLRDRLKG